MREGIIAITDLVSDTVIENKSTVETAEAGIAGHGIV
jgi:hypothetical protein